MRTLSDYEKLENVLFTESQIEQIRKGYKSGLTDKQVATYAQPEIPTLCMMEKLEELVKENEK